MKNSKKRIYGSLVVHCSGDINADCDFKKPDDNNKTQCEFNHDLECLSGQVFNKLIENA